MTLWRLAERHRVSYFGTSAPFILACRKAGLAPAELDLTSIKTIGSTGSPLYAEGFDWIHDHVGADIQIASLSGGTDICTALVGAAPTVPVWKGEISCRALGARVEAFSRTGESLTDEVGELVVTAPMPSMPVFFWGDDGTRLHDSYFADYPGVWRHGDWIRITPRGSCVIEGRSDATLNRGGVRMGTAEFYRVVELLPEVTDSLVVDTSTSSGEGDLLLFVVLADGAELTDVEPRLRSLIRSELSPRHVPGAVVPVSAVPRTLNGKKCEVPIKRRNLSTWLRHLPRLSVLPEALRGRQRADPGDRHHPPRSPRIRRSPPMPGATGTMPAVGSSAGVAPRLAGRWASWALCRCRSMGRR